MATDQYECEICSQAYPSYRAMMLCEEACIQENRDARRPVKAVTPRVRVDDD